MTNFDAKEVIREKIRRFEETKPESEYPVPNYRVISIIKELEAVLAELERLENKK